MNNPNTSVQSSDWYFGLYTVPIRLMIQDILMFFPSLSFSFVGKTGMVQWSRTTFYFQFTCIITSFKVLLSQITPALNAASLNGPRTLLYTGFPHTKQHTPGVKLWSTMAISKFDNLLHVDQRTGVRNRSLWYCEHSHTSSAICTMTSMCTAI